MTTQIKYTPGRPEVPAVEAIPATPGSITMTITEDQALYLLAAIGPLHPERFDTGLDGSIYAGLHAALVPWAGFSNSPSGAYKYSERNAEKLRRLSNQWQANYQVK